MMIMGLFISIFTLLNFFTVLLFGKRNKTFYDFFTKTQVWAANSAMYFAGACEARPPLHPF